MVDIDDKIRFGSVTKGDFSSPLQKYLTPSPPVPHKEGRVGFCDIYGLKEGELRDKDGNKDGDEYEDKDGDKDRRSRIAARAVGIAYLHSCPMPQGLHPFIRHPTL